MLTGALYSLQSNITRPGCLFAFGRTGFILPIFCLNIDHHGNMHHTTESKTKLNIRALTRDAPPCSLLPGIPLWSRLLRKPPDITWPPGHHLGSWLITCLCPRLIMSSSNLIFLSSALAEKSFVTLLVKN